MENEKNSVQDNYVKLNFVLYVTKTDKLIEYMGVDRPTINILEDKLQRTMEEKIEARFKEYNPEFSGKVIMNEVIGNRIEGQYRSNTLVKKKHEMICLKMLKDELERISGAEATVNVNMSCFL